MAANSSWSLLYPQQLPETCFLSKINLAHGRYNGGTMFP